METKNISNERELEIIQELRSGNGYFADAFTSYDFDRMENNIRNDFPLLHQTSVVDSSEYNQLKDEFSKQVSKNDKLHTTIDSLIDAMLKSGQAFSDFSLFREVIALKGHTYVIKRKLELDLPLLPMDKDFLLNNL